MRKLCLVLTFRDESPNDLHWENLRGKKKGITLGNIELYIFNYQIYWIDNISFAKWE